jgi:hypothetical protein
MNKNAEQVFDDVKTRITTLLKDEMNADDAYLAWKRKEAANGDKYEVQRLKAVHDQMQIAYSNSLRTNVQLINHASATLHMLAGGKKYTQDDIDRTASANAAPPDPSKEDEPLEGGGWRRSHVLNPLTYTSTGNDDWNLRRHRNSKYEDQSARLPRFIPTHEGFYMRWQPCFDQEDDRSFDALLKEKLDIVNNYVLLDEQIKEADRARDREQRNVRMNQVKECLADRDALWGTGWARMCRISDQAEHLQVMTGNQAPADKTWNIPYDVGKRLSSVANELKAALPPDMKSMVPANHAGVNVVGYESIVGKWIKRGSLNVLDPGKPGLLFEMADQKVASAVLNAFIETWMARQRARGVTSCRFPNQRLPFSWDMDFLRKMFEGLRIPWRGSFGLDWLRIFVPPLAMIAWPFSWKWRKSAGDCDCDALWATINMLEKALGLPLSGPNAAKNAALPPYTPSPLPAMVSLGTQTEVTIPSEGSTKLQDFLLGTDAIPERRWTSPDDPGAIIRSASQVSLDVPQNFFKSSRRRRATTPAYRGGASSRSSPLAPFALAATVVAMAVFGSA